MTAIASTPRVAKTTPNTPVADPADADQLLRDVAFVLRLTRRVKDQMVADRRQETLPARVAEGVLVA